MSCKIVLWHRWKVGGTTISGGEELPLSVIHSLSDVWPVFVLKVYWDVECLLLGLLAAFTCLHQACCGVERTHTWFPGASGLCRYVFPDEAMASASLDGRSSEYVVARSPEAALQQAQSRCALGLPSHTAHLACRKGNQEIQVQQAKIRLGCLSWHRAVRIGV